jgi:ferredoxin--NADP+ reductase
MRSVGYRSVPIVGVPFDDRRGLIPNQAGRITDRPDGALWPRGYVVGWAKRGPSGIIGTNKPDSVATVQSMKADWEGMADRAAISLPDVRPLLQARCEAVVEYAGWQAIDAYEVAQGAAQQRPRVKVTNVAQMLEIAQSK